jgi:hypothetical protein
MTTTWQIIDTKYQTADGLITEIIYGCTAQLDNFLDRKIGTLVLTGDPTSSDFIPFDNLTEVNILKWVKTSLGDTAVIDIETSLQQSIENQKAARDAQTTKQGLPWRK